MVVSAGVVGAGVVGAARPGARVVVVVGVHAVVGVARPGVVDVVVVVVGNGRSGRARVVRHHTADADAYPHRTVFELGVEVHARRTVTELHLDFGADAAVDFAGEPGVRVDREDGEGGAVAPEGHAARVTGGEGLRRTGRDRDVRLRLAALVAVATDVVVGQRVLGQRVGGE